MNTEKLYTICTTLSNELGTSQLIGHLTNITNTLSNLINQSNSSYQQQLTQFITTITEVLEKSEYNNYSPSWRQIISELAPKVVLGNELASWIRQVFEKNQITYSLAFSELTTMTTNINQLQSGISSVISGFAQLNLSENIDVDLQCEVGVLIPRKSVEDSLEKFAKEVLEFNFIFETFNEYVSGSKEKVQIRGISSSDLMFYAGATIAVGAAIAKSVQWIIDQYKKILEIRKIKLDLEKLQVPAKVTDGLTTHSNGLMEEQIENLIKTLHKEYAGHSDKHRINELENAIRISLRKIANRVDSGYNIEVRTTEKISEEETTKEAAEITKHVRTIKETERTINFRAFDGQRILALPENDESDKK